MSAAITTDLDRAVAALRELAKVRRKGGIWDECKWCGWERGWHRGDCPTLVAQEALLELGLLDTASRTEPLR